MMLSLLYLEELDRWVFVQNGRFSIILWKSDIFSFSIIGSVVYRFLFVFKLVPQMCKLEKEGNNSQTNHAKSKANWRSIKARAIMTIERDQKTLTDEEVEMC